jgi:hypothetical protein
MLVVEVSVLLDVVLVVLARVPVVDVALVALVASALLVSEIDVALAMVVVSEVLEIDDDGLVVITGSLVEDVVMEPSLS